MFKNYNIQRKLGEGGYASVYLCKDEVGVRYAVKKLPKSKNIIERIYKEVAVMKKVQTIPMAKDYEK